MGVDIVWDPLVSLRTRSSSGRRPAEAILARRRDACRLAGVVEVFSAAGEATLPGGEYLTEAIEAARHYWGCEKSQEKVG